MSFLVRARPKFGSTLRSLLINCPRTFTSRAYAPIQIHPSSLRKSILFSDLKTVQIQRLLSIQIRLSSSEDAAGFIASDNEETTQTNNEDSRERLPSVRTLDRNFVGFEARCQRKDRVDQNDFVKVFDLFTKVIQNLGNDISKINSETASNIILYTNILLKCCGKLMVDTPPKGRELLLGNLWTFIKDKSIPLDISHYNSLIRAMNENETTYDPKKILEEIESYNLKADRVTYQRLIHQYCLQGDIVGATNLLEKMKDLGMELNEQIFASLIIGYSKQENCPTIKEMFDLMRSNDIEPNSSSYCAAFKVLASKLDKDPKVIDQFDELCTLFERDEVRLSQSDQIDLILILTPIRSKHESVDKLTQILTDTLSLSFGARYRYLTGLLRENHLEQASNFFWAQKFGDRVSQSGAVGSYWIKALACNRNVPFEFALKQCQMLKERGLNRTPFHHLFYYAVEAGHLNLVRATLDVIGETEPVKIQMKWPLIAQANNESDLIEVLKNDLNPRMDPNDLSETFSQWVWPKFSGNIQRLFDLNKELKYDNSILITSFLSYAALEHKFNEALKFISEAPEAILSDVSQEHKQYDDDDGSNDDIQTTPRLTSENDRGNLITVLLHQIVDQTKDAEIVRKAFNVCQLPGQPISVRALAALVRVHIMNSDYDTAIEEFIRISREYRATPCRAELMKHCLETKNPEQLQKIMSCVTEIHGEQNSLFDLAVCCLKIGKLKQAQKIFGSPGFRVQPNRVYVTCRLIARSRQLEVLENFVSLTRDMYDVNQEYLYRVLLEVYEQTSNPERALHLWNMMQDEDFQPSKRSLIMIADILERHGIQVPFQRPSMSFWGQRNTRGSNERFEDKVQSF